MKVMIDLSNVDWALLRQQKHALIQARATSEPLAGLVHLLDDIQDQAAKILGEKAVFGGVRMISASERFLRSILDELEDMGVGGDEPIDGADAVDYLNDLRDELRTYLKLP